MLKAYFNIIILQEIEIDTLIEIGPIFWEFYITLPTLPVCEIRNRGGTSEK